jgi:hypothetical protein
MVQRFFAIIEAQGSAEGKYSTGLPSKPSDRSCCGFQSHAPPIIISGMGLIGRNERQAAVSAQGRTCYVIVDTD